MKVKLPDVTKKKKKNNEVEEVLIELKNIIESNFDKKILVLIMTSSTINNDKETVLSYAAYLSFLNKNKFSYRLFEINCINPDGGLPVNVVAFSGPSESFGIANSKDDLIKIIEMIFEMDRTQTIILSNFK